MTTQPEQLADVVQLTALMRAKEQELARIGERRRQAVLRHRAATPPVSYADLATAMGVSEARLYKIIKGPRDHVPRGARAAAS